MTNAQILKLAIEKAVKNGFQWKSIWSGLEGLETNLELYDSEDIHFTSPTGSISNGANDWWDMNYYRFIFFHDFAKAFWGNEPKYHLLEDVDTAQEDTTVVDVWIKLPYWKYNLQQMVLEENPLKYLEQFLENKLLQTDQG